MATEKKQKSKKTLLIIGIILAIAALFLGIGYFITGSVIFARNTIALFTMGGVGAAIAVPAVKGIGYLINNSGKNRSRTRDLTRSQEREQTQTMEEVPEEEEEYAEEYEGEMEILPNEKKQNKSAGRR